MKNVQMILITILKYLPLILTIAPIVSIIIFINLPSNYGDYSIPILNITRIQVKDFVYDYNWIIGLNFVINIVIIIFLRLFKQKIFAEEICLIFGLFPAMLYSIYLFEFLPY
ncbi:MAG: hypothetical protein CVV22_11015 [Ignavibacteriae bacterium HGW-Ignavibacteriae-1]|jgi:hypothetical protein|nr:MAG: hypothetical protein CVV22_11015 [Ignavibacteriae bacterium HGW-Ignavibacteriae-1]